MTVTVAGADAPWLCRADACRVITSVEYSKEAKHDEYSDIRMR